MKPVPFLVIFLCLIHVSQALADIAADLETVENQLSQFETDQTSPLRESYQQAALHLREAIRQEQLATRLRQEIDQQPAAIDQARSATYPPRALPNIAQQDLAKLEQQLVAEKASLIDLQQRRNSLSQIISTSDQAVLKVSQQQARLQQLIDTSVAKPDLANATELQRAKAMLDQSILQERQATLKLLELKLLALPGQVELATLQLEEVQRDTELQEQWISRAEQSIRAQSRAETEKTLSELEPITPQNNPLLQQALDRNQQLGSTVRTLLTQLEQSRQQRDSLQQQLELLKQNQQAIQLQLELGVGYTSTEIRKYSQLLSKPLSSEATRKSLQQLRLDQLNLSRSQDQIMPAALSQEEHRIFAQINQDYIRLNSELRSLQQQQISELSLILSVQEQINLQIRNSKALFNKHLLWLPNLNPVDKRWGHDVIAGTAELLHQLPARLWQQSILILSRLTPVLVILVLLLIPAWLLYQYLQRNQARWCDQIGNVRHDHISHTLKPLLYGPLALLPLPTLFWFCAGAIESTSEFQPLATTFQAAAVITLLYLCLRFWLQYPYGLLTGQFGLPGPLIAPLKRRISLLFWINTPLVLLLFSTALVDTNQVTSGPARLTLLAITLFFTLFWASLWRLAPLLQESRERPRIWSNARAWIGLLVIFNLTMIGLILWGYMLSATILIGLTFILACIAILTYLLYQLGQRWLLIEERRLHFTRLKARRAEIIAARQEQKDEPLPREDFVDIRTISAQGSMLLKTAVTVVFLTLLWLTLGWTLPTLEILDSITLWSTSSVSAEGEVLDQITLKQLIFALAALAITLIAARNLPGLLELLILNYLPLAQGTGFAISTLLKYSLIIIGIISFLNFLGLEWSKLQWLIAALGVGLGFGLQEIVANFVSGLIILFEKPVRIGDTVTIGGVTGTVSRIQIRATTITDWDRKEVIIPNKTFITDQLINWSLTDAITRIIINVGVAYGSDTELVQRLLLQAAQDNSNVLDEPDPAALFLAFGASTLDFELRAHVNSMDNRSQTIHELHTAIDRLFRQHHVEIAFSRLDIQLRNDDDSEK